MLDYETKFASLWKGTGKKSGKPFWSGPLADESDRRLLLFANDKRGVSNRPDLIAFIVDDSDGEVKQGGKQEQEDYSDIPF